ncbi:MAG TPA: YceI family protein [Mucilaginibacter sp.]|jgi:polyisoprenoid-binding protein YceI
MKRILFQLLIVLSANTGFSQIKNSITHCAITFQIKNVGISTAGSIGGLMANVQFNPNDLPSSNITASADVNTINTDNDDRDSHLKSEDFFDVAHFPQISLKSVSFKHKSGTRYQGTFNLTIKGKTKLIELPFAYTDKGNTAVFQGNFKMNRLDFGIGEGSMVLSNEVIVNINAEISK